MRPFGHTEARDARDDRITSLDIRLQEAWAQYLTALSTVRIDTTYSLFIIAKTFLAPLRPDLMALHRHALLTSHPTKTWGAALGCFITAGYSLLPEREIVYPLHTPDLDALGSHLQNKHLIIDGTVGAGVGIEMIGQLTNNGEIGNDPGHSMIGTFTNNGKTGLRPANQLIGRYIDKDKYRFTGYVIGYCRGWSRSIPEASRAAFLRAITNPDALPYADLYESLEEEYG